MNPKHIEKALAHDIDVAWIIALWLHIHGGDPGPEENQLTNLLAESLATQLRERLPNLSQDPLAILKKLNALGIKVTGRTPDKQEFELKDQNHWQTTALQCVTFGVSFRRKRGARAKLSLRNFELCACLCESAVPQR